MDAVVGVSNRAGVTDALDEALRGISNPQGIIFTADYSRLVDIGKELKERFPEAQMIGTSGTAYYNTTIAESGLLIVTAIKSRAVVSANVIQNLSTRPLSELYRLKDSVQKVGPGSGDTVCLEFCTNDEEQLVSTFNVILEKKKVPLIGGTVFGAPAGKPPIVIVNGKAFTDACGYMIVKNTAGKAHVFRENIYACPEGRPAHIATKVNLEKKELIELDRRPAADVYTEDTGVAKNSIVDNVFLEPLGRVVDGEVYISSMHGMGNRGSLLNYKRINENDQIYVLKRLDYRNIVKESVRQINGISPRPSLIVAFNCIYRYLMFQSEGYTAEYLREMSEAGPFVGYVAGGEQYINQHVNQTMVCVIFD